MNKIRLSLLLLPLLIIQIQGYSLTLKQADPKGNLSANKVEVSKVKDLIIYKDSLFYSSFPSVVKKPNVDILVAFRRAPDRRLFGEPNYSHTDQNSYLMMVRSKDAEHWSKEPSLISAHPFGGSQDPCLLQLKDGTLICTSYIWSLIRPDADSVLNRKLTIVKGGKSAHSQSYTFLGGYLVRSTDGGQKWDAPIYPIHIPSDAQSDVWGKPIPAYNRGALVEGKNGKIYWAVAGNSVKYPTKVDNHLLVSDDKGLTWNYSGLIASDEKITFNETSIYETPKGDLVAFMRTANMPNQYSCIARSTNGGKSFTWQSMDFYGFPLHALKLPDNRVLLTYGYRKKPYGIRGRILNSECTDFATAPEFIIREDGGGGDLGYCWSTMLDKNRILVVYYFNSNNVTRYIAGTILELKTKNTTH
ncbi:MAG: sialidase family protein [Bacteroidia bacterium]|nr:sialidase family protein [Bacteroidia bacterium]